MDYSAILETCFHIEAESKTFQSDELRSLISCMDLTTLEGTDTPDRVRQLCHKAVAPAPDLPACAAVCVYPRFVGCAREALKGMKVRVVSVAGGFPSGQTFLEVKLAEIRMAVGEGADEIDVVMDRGAFLAGDHSRVVDEIAAMKDACGGVRLKVILETGELGAQEHIRRASDLVIGAGADFIKTSTGKIAVGATLSSVWVMCESIRDAFQRNGTRVGIKAAGGVRKASDAVAYRRVVREVLGAEWLAPDLFRIGASTLLDDVVRELRVDSSAKV